METAKARPIIDLKGSGSVSINWGNGKSNTYPLTMSTLRISHAYTDSATHTITITGDNIVSLVCGNNQLTSLNVTKCASLIELTCSENSLATLNVSGYTKLQRIECGCNKLTKLVVNNCTSLGRIYCDNNQLTALDLKGLTKLSFLRFYNNKLKTLVVGGCTLLLYQYELFKKPVAKRLPNIDRATSYIFACYS